MSRRPDSPSVRAPGSACSRAAASAVTLLIVPPLVNAPIVAGNPTNSLTQRTAWCSICVAARASTARLMSYVWASRSAIAPISSPDEPMNAKYRGRGCAIDSSRMRAASSSASCTDTGSPGSPAPRSPRTRSSSAGSSGRYRSKLRHASSTSFAACARTSSRGASSRSGRSGSVMRSMVRPRSGIPSRAEVRQHAARRRPPLHQQGDHDPDHEQQPRAYSGARIVGLGTL